MQSVISIATSDIFAALKKYKLVSMLGWQDVKQRYRRSALGPFWITISMGVMISAIGGVFGRIFNSPMSDFLPFLAAGMIVWTLLSSVITEGCFGFVSSEAVIKQLPIPLFVHILKVIWRNILIFLHNILIIPLIFIFFCKLPSFSAFLCIPGLFLLMLNLSWISLILGVICSRYRDLPQIVASILQVAYFLTPIMWMPSQLPRHSDVYTYLLDLNPAFHLIEIVRAPLLGQLPSMTSWYTAIGLAVVGWGIAIAIFGRYRNRIAYWL
ncbi:ABC transporter permease [Musicola paradisiaca]|uniref:Transport permease protein n=1 Tax=Musicola paradisiaca (strain Ech703) TaxID=579405 RepID=C6CAG3_MUSP7|nr:ABC transporter permease [Musicola paradisiaca]ACS86461.1 ABC-2 type transporter [Musicola paradisiaca Ech703]